MKKWQLRFFYTKAAVFAEDTFLLNSLMLVRNKKHIP